MTDPIFTFASYSLWGGGGGGGGEREKEYQLCGEGQRALFCEMIIYKLIRKFSS